jgi:hypothetical protein
MSNGLYENDPPPAATLPQLVSDLLLAKLTEENAKKARIEVEEKIAAIIPGPERGQKTAKIEGFSVTVERGFNYKANVQAIVDDWPKIENCPAPIKTKATVELDEKGYEYYRENVQPLFDKHLAPNVQVTPKKISVTLKETKK